MALRESRQLGEARHRSVGVGDLADHADRPEPRHDAEVDGRLGLSRADQHAALASAEREDVPRLHEVGRPRRRVREDVNGARAIGRADAGRDALAGVDADRERGPETGLVPRDHLREVELLHPLRRHRHADDAARVLADERDVLRPAALRRHDEVALVLALLVVEDDDHPSAADLLRRVLDAGEG